MILDNDLKKIKGLQPYPNSKPEAINNVRCVLSFLIKKKVSILIKNWIENFH